MRCYAGSLEATTTPTATAGAQLESSGTAHPFWVLECGAFNSTATATTAGLIRFTASGTLGATLVEVAEDELFVPLTVASGVNSTAATVTTGAQYTVAALGAAIGAGVIWTFGGKGLHVTGATDAGMMLNCPNGTGQMRDFYWVWEE